MMAFMKDKHVMVKNMDQENIILRTEIFLMDKCIKEWCKEKESTLGQIKTFIKEILFKIKCVDLEN